MVVGASDCFNVSYMCNASMIPDSCRVTRPIFLPEHKVPMRQCVDGSNAPIGAGISVLCVQEETSQGDGRKATDQRN
jgi:hypothetical protein